MTAIDKAILDTNENICKNISKATPDERGFLSQNLLSQLRNFVEYIGLKLCSGDINIDPNIEYFERTKILKKLGSRTDLHFLYKLHNFLQKSASHYTLDENASERLMLKYYEYLLKIKKYLKINYSLEVLSNIEQFPINTDKQLYEFYEKISEKIDNFSLQTEQPFYNEKLYIQKIKPFFVNKKIYYEVTFTLATDNVSKFDRIIAFTNLEIVENYAVKFTIHKDKISIVDNEMEINIIDSWLPAIRSCEFKNLNFIINGTEKIKSNPIAYNGVMNFIHDTNMNLLDLVVSQNDLYNYVKKTINETANNTALFDIFDKCRNIITNNKSGSNILRYLLYTMNNKILKKQINPEKPCELLSNLYLDYGTIPFDQMPLTTSLKGHNPRIYDLLECIETDGREHEFLARYIKKNTEQNNILFTNSKNLESLPNTDDLINIYNSKIYIKHRQTRSIYKYNQFYYINEYAEDCSYIIKQFKELSQKGLKNYSASVESWLTHNSSLVDDDIKKKALIKMFENSRVSFIYGSAGTGKSTLIKHISSFFASREKLYLANTNPAVENLKRKINITNCEFMTISKFLAGHKVEYDILFLDECSTVSNSDMRKILETTNFKLIVLVGDIYQIEAIQFGNWFSLAKKFIPQTSIFELTNTFRSSDKKLKLVWDRVRNLDDGMQEALDKFNYTKRLDNSVFEKNNKDEIILCLNYDGLYGINNINTFLQNSNKNKSYSYGLHSYKIDDPILFNEANKFTPIIYNNMKGWIRNIKENEQFITFDIEIEASLNELDADGYAFILLGNTENGNSIIRFSIEKNINTDEDNESNSMPFQIAYAISIHKAQGLEYDSVKIIISNEIEEQISHNIFYTAITRAKKQLQIYWSPEVEHNILSKMKMKQDNLTDANVLKILYKL